MNFLHSKAINKAYIAELLYGENSPTTRSKLAQKVRKEKNFTQTEKQRLEEIRKQIINELAS